MDIDQRLSQLEEQIKERGLDQSIVYNADVGFIFGYLVILDGRGGRLEYTIHRHIHSSGSEIDHLIPIKHYHKLE